MKASKKIHTLSHVIKYYIDSSERRLFMKSFITWQFSHCLLIWMFQSRNMKNKINIIHERDLRLVCGDLQDLIFNDLLLKDKSVTKKQKILYILVTELYKAKQGIYPKQI